MRVNRLDARFVHEIPEALEDGILYVCEECQVALHNCACGCGEEVSTPFVRTEYSLTMHDGEASIWPSIGNHDFACKSHYVIRRGEILWAGRMSRAEIEWGRQKDRALKRPRPSPAVPTYVSGSEPTTTAPSYARRRAPTAVIDWLKEVWTRVFGR